MAQLSGDDSNLPLRILAGLALSAAAVGVVLLIAGAAVYGVALLGFAFQTWILLLLFWAWRYERRAVPAAAYPAITADALAAAIKRAMTLDSAKPATAVEQPALNRAQRDAAAAQATTRSEQQFSTATIPPTPVMNRMQQEAAARAAAAKSRQVLRTGWSEEQK